MYINPKCVSSMKSFGEERFRFILTWIIAREKHRDTYNDENFINHLDRLAYDAWKKFENGTPLDDALEPLTSQPNTHALSQPITPSCIDAVKAVLSHVPGNVIKDTPEDLSRGDPLQGLGYDRSTCTMDWIEAANVGRMLRGGSSESAKCDLVYAIETWVRFRQTHPDKAYSSNVARDPVYACDPPMPMCSTLQLSDNLQTMSMNATSGLPWWVWLSLAAGGYLIYANRKKLIK